MSYSPIGRTANVRFDDDEIIPALELIEDSGVTIRENAKVNVGLGRPLVEA